jgi:CubicO group peptidase (beta-lactamase class C family)
MKNIVIGFLILFISLSCTQSGTNKRSSQLSEAPPESVGMSSERLARIDTMCAREVEKGNIPGVVALVARNGNIVLYKAYGKADNESGRELKRDAIFRIASQTKAIISAAVLTLWEEGKFQLDDPISKFIPEFKNPTVIKTFNKSDTTYTTEPSKSEITIRNLLTHTSGIGWGDGEEYENFTMIYQKAGIISLFTTKDITLAENIKKLAGLPLHDNPGVRFIYGESIDVLGYLIEIISGMPLDKFLRMRIFDPLGMNDTWFYLPSEKTDRLVPVQTKINGEWKHLPVTFYDPDFPVKGAKRYFSGGAGLCSTAKDYAIFLQMLLNGGEFNERRLLSRTTVKLMMTNQIRNLHPLGDTNKGFGFGFAISTEKDEVRGGQNSAGTILWWGYFNTSYFADPKEQTIGILLKQTQDANSDESYWKFNILVDQALDDK